MNQMSKKEAILFACCDSLYWGCVACFLGFAGCFFLDCGMESSVLSLVIAAYQLLALGGGFFWGGLCDRLETNAIGWRQTGKFSFRFLRVIWYACRSRTILGRGIFRLPA